MIACRFKSIFRAIMSYIGRTRRKNLDQANKELIEARSAARKEALQKGAEAVQKLNYEFSRLLGS